jgi:hypothetical protein
MGYTHYWTTFKTVDTNKITDLKADLEKLSNGSGDHGSLPELSDEEIVFNGVEHDAHETFHFEFDNTVKFDCCKTAHKPYDEVVTAVLTVLKLYMGDDLSVRSDGEPTDWANGVAFA